MGQTEVDRLREELRATKESLQAIIEEQEATNEELKSANEEIESSNEELQSSNEELETAKEELQSTNEELQTLNEELANRNAEMAHVNNDLQNLLASISLPIVMVDNSLAIRRVTPQAEKLFNLVPADLGRRLGDLKPSLVIGDIDQVIRNVIDTLETVELEVEDLDGRPYSMRVRPYRTRDNKIDGAVVTVVDIHAIRQTTQAPLKPEILQRILNFQASPAVAVMGNGEMVACNELFRKRFKIKRQDIQKARIYDLNSGAWNFPELRTALKNAQSQEIQVKNGKLATLAGGEAFLRLLRLDEVRGTTLISVSISGS